MVKNSLILVLTLPFLMLLAPMAYPQTVTIGTQVWSTKNLDVSSFRNGDPIPQAKTKEEWEQAGKNKQPAWCYYDNDPANGAKYGKLYNWYAVIDERGLAPSGYHIPSDAEWEILVSYLGNAAGVKMKAASGWKSYKMGGSKTCPNCKDWSDEYRNKVPCHTCKDTRSVSAPTVTHSGNGTNSSGFSGLPGGFRYKGTGTFIQLGESGKWWSSTVSTTGYAWSRIIFKEHGFVTRYGGSEVEEGLSVRCLRN